MRRGGEVLPARGWGWGGQVSLSTSIELYTCLTILCEWRCLTLPQGQLFTRGVGLLYHPHPPSVPTPLELNIPTGAFCDNDRL